MSRSENSLWRDLGQFHSYEGFFSTSLKTIRGIESKNKSEVAARGIQKQSGCPRLRRYIDPIVSTPQGLFFTAGRCGSTLLLKSLARSRRVTLLSVEADVHNGIWSQYTKNWTSPPEPNENNIRQYRRLILATGAKAPGDASVILHQVYFIQYSDVGVYSACVPRRSDAFSIQNTSRYSLVI